MLKYNFTFFILLNVLLLIFFSSCGSEPVPVYYGIDECEFCRMLIADNRYGAELVTDKGKIFKFDSIECLVDFALAKNLIGDEKQYMFVTDFSDPEKLIECKTAYYIHNENYRSPMGLNVSSFGNQDSAQKFLTNSGGNQLSWLDVIEMVKQSGM